MARIDELRECLGELNESAQTITAQAEAEKRDLSTDDRKELDRILADFRTCQDDISRLEELEAQTTDLHKGTGRKTAPNQPTQLAAPPDPDADDLDDEPPPAATPRRRQLAQNQRVAAQIDTGRGKGGFRSLGDMAYHVARACMEGGVLDPRLERLAAATTYGSEGTGADGGFAVPPDFRSAIMEKVLGEESLLPFCDQVPTSSNVFTMPVDETTPWQTTGGIQAYWDGEAQAATQSKPALEERTVKLNKVRALVPVTEELLEDAPAMDAYLRRKAPSKIAFKVSLALLQGTGTGQPLGVLNSTALVTVSKETSQIADSIVANNIVKMWARLYSPCRGNARWFINQDIEPFLNTMSMPGRDNTGTAVTAWGFPVYTPAGGLSVGPYATLMGRPVIPTQACETLGDLGDIVLADMSMYLALIKSGVNPRVETSMHLWFDQDLMAFKFVLRIGGIPWWGSSISPRDGSNTLSCFVALEARA